MDVDVVVVVSVVDDGDLVMVFHKVLFVWYYVSSVKDSDGV